MENQGLNTYQYQYPQAYTVPAKDEKQSAVNVYINTPQAYGGAAYPYPYYYPYYYPYPYYTPQQTSNAVATQDLGKTQPTRPEPKKEEKNLTPLTPELLNELKNDLAQGDKKTRQHAIARAINLINEDRESRQHNPALNDLIKIAAHPNQPRSVREAAEIASSSIKYDVPKGKRLDVVSQG